MSLKHIGFERVDCIYLVKGTDKYGTVFNIALNILIP